MSDSVKIGLKHSINLLSAFVSGATAFIFIAYALQYNGIAFLNENKTIIIWVTFGVCLTAFVAYVMFYAFEKQAAYRFILLCLIFADIFSLVLYILCATGLITKITSIQALRDAIDNFGAWAAVLYILFSFLQVVVLPVPGSVTVAAGVALFGPFECSIYSFIGIVLGSIVAFAIGRFIGYKAVCWMVGEETLNKWLNKVKGKDYLILSLMFLLPMFPDDVLCFVAGLSSMSWRYYIIMIIITRLLSVVSTSYSFNFIPINTWWGILIWVFLATIVVLCFWIVLKYADKIDGFLKRKIKNKKKEVK